MRHNLADRENEIESAVGDELVDLRGPCVVELAFRLFADELRWHFAQCLDVGAPVVNLE